VIPGGSTKFYLSEPRTGERFRSGIRSRLLERLKDLEKSASIRRDGTGFVSGFYRKKRRIMKREKRTERANRPQRTIGEIYSRGFNRKRLSYRSTRRRKALQ